MDVLIVLALAAAAGLITFYLVATWAGLPMRRVSGVSATARLRAWLRRREEASRRSASPSDLSGAGAAIANTVLDLLPASRETQEQQLQALRRTGMRMGAAQFWALQILCVAAGLVLGAMASGTLLSGSSGAGWALLAGPALGWLLPQVYLLSRRKRWRDEIERQLPNALDLMAISVAAGTTLESAVRTVAETTDGALAEGLADVVAQARFGDLTDALKAFADNAGVQPLTIFTASLIQARNQGLPLADILRLQADSVREMRRMRLEELINKLPVKIIFPIVFFIFPALFGFVLVPAAYRMLTTLSAL